MSSLGPQGIPPELLSALAGGGGPAAAGAPQDQGPPQGPAGDQSQGPDTQDSVSILQKMIDLAMQYQQVEEDPEDRATMAKVLATLRQYEAKEQKELDAALGTSPAARFMRRSSSRGA